MRVYLSSDVVGVELGGALKNIFAIAAGTHPPLRGPFHPSYSRRSYAGAVEGMGFGMNTTAMLVTRGCKEMTRLAVAMGADTATLRYCRRAPRSRAATSAESAI